MSLSAKRSRRVLIGRSAAALSRFRMLPAAAGRRSRLRQRLRSGAQPSISNYDDLIEGSLGTSIVYNGVSYHDVNGIGGVFPDGSTFTPEDVGDQLIIEDATDFYDVHPDYGSAPNSLTFGSAYIPGPNLTIGALVRVTMDLDQPASAASVDIGYYENGPWGGIEIHLDALDAGTVVASDVITIAERRRPRQRHDRNAQRRRRRRSTV